MGRSGKLAFLPIVTKARELEARVLLAAHLAGRGFRVVLGHQSPVDYRARHARDAVYFSPLLVPATESRLRAFRARGHRIVAWDEEGLVYPDPAWYFANRVGAASAGLADVLIAWGEAAAQDWLATLPDGAARLLPLGNARLDLLRDPYRAMYAQEGRALAARFGRYVLVNTNFDLINHADGERGLLKRLEASGRLSTATDVARFERWSAFRQAMFDAFMQGLPLLHDALPDLHFVIRPHPSENLAPYAALVERFVRMSLEPAAGPVLPWICGAEAILHNSCTTAVEAYVLGTPAIAYDPPDVSGEGMDSPLPNLLSLREADWAGVADRLRRLRRDAAHTADDDVLRETARRYIGSLEGESSAQRLASIADDLAAKGPPARLGTPPLARRARRALSATVRGLGFGYQPGPDDRRRFPGLETAELTALAERIGPLAGTPLAVTRLEPNAFVIESRTSTRT